MITVTLIAGFGLPPITVQVADGKECAVLSRAQERIFPGPVIPEIEAASEESYRAVLTARAARKRKARG